MDLASIKTTDNTERNRFELEVDEDIAFIDYKIGKSGSIYLIHTEVPKQLEGKGVGHKIVRESLELIEKENLKIVPLCPFIRSYLKKHRSEYEHLIAEGAKL